MMSSQATSLWLYLLAATSTTDSASGRRRLWHGIAHYPLELGHREDCRREKFTRIREILVAGDKVIRFSDEGTGQENRVFLVAWIVCDDIGDNRSGRSVKKLEPLIKQLSGQAESRSTKDGFVFGENFCRSEPKPVGVRNDPLD